MKSVTIYLILFLFLFSLHSMELKEIIIDNQKDEIDRSSIPKLKFLAAKAYAKKYQILPKQEIPEECHDLIKLYLPIKPSLCEEYLSIALKFQRDTRIIECCQHLVNKYASEKSIVCYTNDEKFYLECEKKLQKFLLSFNLPQEEQKLLIPLLQEELKKECKKRFNWYDPCITCYILFGCCLGWSLIIGGILFAKFA